MSLDLLDESPTSTRFSDGGGGVMAGQTIWVDTDDNPWRHNALTNRYERLDASGTWVIDSPTTSLRRVRQTPSPTPPVPGDGHVVIGVADQHTFFIKGDKGDRGEKGDKGDRGDQGIPGDSTLVSQVIDEVPMGVKDGFNAAFNTQHSFEANSVILYCNGLRERHGVGFLETGPNEITITSPPDALDTIVVDYLMA